MAAVVRSVYFRSPAMLQAIPEETLVDRGALGCTVFPTLTIRSATAHDIPRLQEIEKSARSRYREINRLLFAAKTPAIAASRLMEGDVFVGEEEVGPVGFVLLNAIERHALHSQPLFHPFIFRPRGRRGSDRGGGRPGKITRSTSAHADDFQKTPMECSLVSPTWFRAHASR